MEHKLQAFERLLRIMDELREKCPWDRKQTMKSLSSLTIEETYELVSAIRNEDYEDCKEEIGDVMLHMVFYTKIADEMNLFDMADALNAVCTKLIRRHPHIYGDTQVEGEKEVKQNWERIKLSEGKKTLLEGVPDVLPPIIKAQRMQEKAAQVGFEWERSEQVWEKVVEEIDEFKEVTIEDNKEKMEEEFGDVLFSLINYARFMGIDSHLALEKTNDKFRSRVEYIEKESVKPLSEMSLDEMDALWEAAKTL